MGGDRPILRVKCWRPVTEAQGFAGKRAPTWPVPGCPFLFFQRSAGTDLVHESPQGLVLSSPLHQVSGPFRRSAGNGVPTRPAADYRPALGGKFPAGTLKAEKENGRGHSPFLLSRCRPETFHRVPAGSRQPDELAPHCRPSAEKVRRLGAKGTKEQGLAGIRAPSPYRPSAEKIGKGSRAPAMLAPFCPQNLAPPLRGANILL